MYIFNDAEFAGKIIPACCGIARTVFLLLLTDENEKSWLQDVLVFKRKKKRFGKVIGHQTSVVSGRFVCLKGNKSVLHFAFFLFAPLLEILKGK